MKTNQLNSILAAVAMLATAVCADVFVPQKLMASANPSLNLETMIPNEFGKWKYRPALRLVTPTEPVYVETIEQKDPFVRIFSQEILRMSLDNEGQTLMLLVVDGAAQYY